MLLPVLPPRPRPLGETQSSPEPGRGTPLPSRSFGEPRPLVQTNFNETNGDISPDGRWLAYESFESGRQEVYVRPFPDVNTGRWQISTSGGRMPLWSRNGRELFYVSVDDLLMGVAVGPGSSWVNSTPARVLQGPYAYTVAVPIGFGGTNGRPFDIARDGRFLMIKEGGGGEAAPQNLVVVQHWTAMRLVARILFSLCPA